MPYDRTPPDFMKGIFVAPHNFSDPEHPEHGQYVSIQMKNDLYNDALYRITACEFSLIGAEEEQLEVQKISKCEGSDPFEGFASKLSNKKSQDNELLTCQDWKVVLKSGPKLTSRRTSSYRVKIYQTKTDIFYPQIHPPTLWKCFKYFLSN